MTAMVRTAVAAMIACLGVPAVAARQGAMAEASRGTIAITVSVAPQARFIAEGDAACLWSNTATRLVAVTTADADGHAEALTPEDTMVAAPAPGCAAAGRLTLAALHGGGARTILVSPE